MAKKQKKSKITLIRVTRTIAEKASNHCKEKNGNFRQWADQALESKLFREKNIEL